MLLPAGRVVLISGAGRGIGRAIAETLYERGFSLSLGVREPERVVHELGHIEPARLHVARFDAEDWATHATWVADAVARYGRIDALINNAGAHSAMTLRAPDETELDRLWAINCKAPLNLIHLTLPYLEACGAGRIITLASLSGKRVRNDAVAYNMTKFAVMGLTHTARRLSWDKGVRATAICPSFVRTDMTAGATFPADQMIAPNDLAELVATVLALPNTAALAEMLVNCRLEDTL